MSKQADRAENTLRNYNKAIGLHLVPFFGTRYLSEIRNKHVEDYKQERAKGAQFNTVNLELQQIGTILNTAVRWGYLKESPAKGVKLLRVPEKKPPYLTHSATTGFIRLWPSPSTQECVYQKFWR